MPSQKLSGSYSNINIRGGFLIPAKQISVFSYDLPKPQESLSSDSKKVDETISQYVDYNKTQPAVKFDDKFATKTPITVGGIAAGYYFSEKIDDSKEAAGDTEADKDIPASKLKIVVSSSKDNDENAVKSTGSDNDNGATVDNQTKKEDSMKHEVEDELKKLLS